MTSLALGCNGGSTIPSTLSVKKPPPPLPPPSVTSVSPNTGSTGGGTSLVVNGQGFLPGAKVTLDGTEVTASRDYAGTGLYLYFTAPPHAAGAVDVVVRNPDGQSVTLPGAFTFAPPEIFDFNGNWYAYLGDGNDDPFSFTVGGNALVSVTCYEGTPVTLVSPVLVSHGEIAAYAGGVVIFSARIVGPDSARGTINAGACHSEDWSGWKDQQGAARRAATAPGRSGGRK
jgi:hypothetical protein